MQATDIRLCHLDRLDLATAIAVDHPCEDNACDIAAAVRAGFEEAAAHLLLGATECPRVERAVRRLDIYGTENGRFYGWPRGWIEWTEWHAENGRSCPDCRSYTFADEGEPTNCGNCLAALPERD